MVITSRVREQMFQQSTTNSNALELIRIPLTRQELPQPLDPAAEMPTSPFSRVSTFGAMWTPAEHERFLGGLELFPSGPWRRVAEYIGTKTVRQAMTHAQKYRQKITRRNRGLKSLVRNTQATWPLFTAVAAVATSEVSVRASEHSPPEPELETIVPLWDAAFGDLFMEPFDGCPTLFYSEEPSGDDVVSHLFLEEPGRKPEGMAGHQPIHEDTVMSLGTTISASFSPSSVDETLALETPLSGGLTLEFDFVAHELTRVSHDDIRIWFGE